MTSKITSAILAGTAVLSLTLGATGAQAATESAQARARVLQALTLLNNNRPLEFGAVVAAATPGSVTISSAGARTACAGGISCSGTVSAALFDLTGTANEWVNVNIDASVTLLSGGNSMVATLDPDFAIQLSGTGAATFGVGGTLAVGANQPQGVYAANFNVVADYQ